MLPARAACRACIPLHRALARAHVQARPCPIPSSRLSSSTSSPNSDASLSPPPPSEPFPSRPSPLPSPKDTRTASSKLLDARVRAEKQLRALLKVIDASARKQAQAFSAALHALELERKLREVGGKINQATGYEDIERLRNGVGEKEKALLTARAQALELKKEYTARVITRADSQREVNDLLQRKSTWSSADVLRFTELVQQDHANEQAELQAKTAMEAGEEDVEKGFSELMQAILERYHEEQVWSDKIRSMSTYGSLAITSLNVLLFIITLILIEPWRRRKLVERVEERLRSNTQEGHDVTNAKLESFRTLLEEAQTKLDDLAASTAALASAPAFASPPPRAPSPAPSSEAIPPPPLPPVEAKQPLPPTTEPQRPPQQHPLIEQAKDALEGREMWAAGAAGALGGVVLAVVFSVLGGGR
ncbi:hypothetical protein JCM8547_003949 [Rhodosporidiobolus lusitaniae]